MKSNTFAKTFAIAAVAALALQMAPAAKAADKGCSNASLHGTFAYTGTGVITAPPEIAGPVAEVGTQNFDGRGATTATATLSQNGNLVPLTLTGTYTVNPDCTGTLTLQVSPLDFTLHLFLAIADTGNEFQALETEAGLVVTRIGHLQFPLFGDSRR